MKRCPKGTRKDKNGNCVTKVVSQKSPKKGESLNSCKTNEEWFIDKCYKPCKPNKKRRETTRRCVKTQTEKLKKGECEDGKYWFIDKCYNPCKPTQTRRATTRRCVKIQKTKLPSPLLKEIIASVKSKKYKKSVTKEIIESIKSNKSNKSNKSIAKEMIGSISSVKPLILPDLTVQIDNIQFKLIGKSLDGPYEYIAILGHHMDPEYEGKPYSLFWIYPSKSEIGMWRLAGTKSYGTGYNKLDNRIEEASPSSKYSDYTYYVGDYVQTTLIHLDLQKFVNNNLNNPLLPVIQLGESTNMLEYVNNLPNKNYPIINESNLITPYVRNANLAGAGSGKMYPGSIDYFRNEPKELSPFVRAIHDKSNLSYPYPFVFMSIIQVINPKNMDHNKDFQCGSKPDQRRLNKFSKILSEIYDVRSVDSFADKLTSFEKVMNVKGKIFKVLLRKKAEIKPEYLILDLNIENKELPDKFIQINPETDILPEVVLYFMEVNMDCNNSSSSLFFKNINKICKKEKHYMPILLTVPEAKVNLFGIYEKYINSGNYICKLFDYSKQCSFEETEGENICTEDYTYIGARYDNLFPYKEL
jgi:hypothetical protein